jgi:hypothetical protein
MFLESPTITIPNSHRVIVTRGIKVHIILWPHCRSTENNHPVDPDFDELIFEKKVIWMRIFPPKTSFQSSFKISAFKLFEEK